MSTESSVSLNFWMYFRDSRVLVVLAAIFYVSFSSGKIQAVIRGALIRSLSDCEHSNYMSLLWWYQNINNLSLYPPPPASHTRDLAKGHWRLSSLSPIEAKGVWKSSVKSYADSDWGPLESRSYPLSGLIPLWLLRGKLRFISQSDER